MTRLLVISTHKLFRECLATMLREIESFAVEERDPNLGEIGAVLKSWKPSLLLVDLSRSADVQGCSILELLKAIRASSPDLGVLLLGVREDNPEILDCIELGANGYVSKESTVEELKEAIELVLTGGAVCPPKLAYTMFNRLNDLSSKHQRSLRVEALQLTPREMEILQLIANGCSNKRIADELALSIYTVKNHVHHILDKLNVKRRAEAVEYAIKHHWLRDLPVR